MSRNFNNTDHTNATEAGIALRGWFNNTLPYDSNRIARLNDLIAGGAIHKMGTSIPTPLARLFLFKTAFEQINNYGAPANSLYGRLVSECLDMLEFLYHYGDQVTINTWNINQNVADLNNHINAGCRKLGSSLEPFLNDLQVSNIYLFYYNGILLGGSSPFTLVYTSPNWQRKITEQGYAFSGTNGNPLFPDYAAQNPYITPLNNRHDDFRTYMVKMAAAYNNVQRFIDTPLYNYIRNREVTMFNNLTAQPYTTTDFNNEYTALANGAVIDIFGLGAANAVMLGHKQRFNPQGNTNQQCPAPDYQIISNKIQQGAIPLVLNDYGLTGAQYIGERPWPQNTTLTRNPSETLGQRILPGPGNVAYPYLTDADFLEDKLMKAVFNVNEDDFQFFGNTGNYLLPLKPRFFEYFDIQDLRDNTNGLRMTIREDAQKVKVTLYIPIHYGNGQTIPLEKEYMVASDVINISEVSAAIFPSYKIIDNAIPNAYSVMRYDQRNRYHFEFFSINGCNVTPLNVGDSVARSNANNIYSVNSVFDFIKIVDNNDNSALLIPKFKEVRPNAAARSKVGIDFGTTNTYVCISYDQHNPVPHTLEIDSNSKQVITLNAIDLTNGTSGDSFNDSFAGLNDMATALTREFAPLLLSSQYDNDISLPYRTVTNENDNFANAPNHSLFGNISIGFRFLRDTIQNGSKYNTDIKWGMRTNVPAQRIQAHNRVNAFCHQIAWMIKNHVMLSNNPCSAFDVYLTFPDNMGILRNNIFTSWSNAFNAVLGNGNFTQAQLTESVAPFYYLVAFEGKNFTSNMLNIDIGGGTTDMLFVDTRNQRFLYDSSRFAGNDIWGDGVSLVPGAQIKTSGYVTSFENALNGTPAMQRRMNDYNNYKDIAVDSADLMSYIFKYSEDFNINNIIIGNEKLMAPLYIHYGALVFHISQVLKKHHMDVPENIYLSGMGSSYVKMISNNPDDITNLTKGLLSEFLGFGFHDRENNMPANFHVHFQNEPKIVTAKGAVAMQNPAMDHFGNYRKESIHVYDFNNCPDNLTYQEANAHKNNVLNAYHDFLNIMVNNSDVKRMLRDNFSFRFPVNTYESLTNVESTSFDIMANDNGGDPTGEIKESMFFWPLKNGLYTIAR